MNTKSFKGFTLIELLIVIAIIAVLAVAFVPALLGSPAKARDAARISDIQRMDTVLAARDLEGTGVLPVAADGACIDNALFVNFVPKLGGSVPRDPQSQKDRFYGDAKKCLGNYYYKSAPSAAYEYVLMANVEDPAKANTSCTLALGGAFVPVAATDTPNNICYAVLRAK